MNSTGVTSGSTLPSSAPIGVAVVDALEVEEGALVEAAAVATAAAAAVVATKVAAVVATAVVMAATVLLVVATMPRGRRKTAEEPKLIVLAMEDCRIAFVQYRVSYYL